MSSQELATNNNQVPEGYKKTEVGVIPQDWEVDKFINITEVITCGVAATPKYVTETTGKPFLSAQNVQNGRVIYDNYKFISKELFAQITKHNKPTKGDILYTRVGAGIGEAGVIEDNFEFAIYVSLTLIKPKYQKLDSYWIAYLLNSERYKFLARNGLFAGAGVQNLNVEVVRNFAIPLPPLPEQKAIASVLSDVDVLIAALDKLIAKKRHIKTGTMQQLLTGKTRLPGFDKKWVIKPLGNIADKSIKWSFTGGPFGSNLKSCDYTEQGVQIIQLQNIGDGEFINNSQVFTSEIKADELLSCNIYPGDIILSKMGDPVARACIIPDINPRYLMCSDGIRLCVNKRESDSYFIYSYINSPYFRLLAENASTGSTRKRIGLDSLKKIELSIPPLPEQQAIASILSDMDSEITALEKRRAKTQAIKQGMMQELLTGRTRIIDN